MALKRTDLNKRCFFILSGVSNSLGNSMGKTIAIEIARRIKCGSLMLLIEESEEIMQEVKKEINFLDNDVNVKCCYIESWSSVNVKMFNKVLSDVLANSVIDNFELAFIMHNEGTNATKVLSEPQDPVLWKLYAQENLYAAIYLQQALLNVRQWQCIEEKLVVNLTSTVPATPFMYKNLKSSCKKARDFFFRAFANEETANGFTVLIYSPGILDAHEPELDLNNNIIDVYEMGHQMAKQISKLPHITPLQSTLKLINILEEMAFISGHEVDYYDTYVL